MSVSRLLKPDEEISSKIPVMDGQARQGRRTIIAFFVVQIIGLTILQKIGFPIAVALPIFLVGVLTLVFFGPISISPVRLLLYCILSFTLVFSQILSGRAFSAPSLMLLLVTYIPIIFNFKIEKDDFLKCVNIFQRFMLFIFAVVLLERISQYLYSYRIWPNLNAILPSAILVPNYNYLRETGWQTGVFQPNGIFFLEPSIVSQFLALALIMELVWFKKIWRIVVFGLGMLLTQAGTGFLVIGLTAPLLLKHITPRLMPALIVGVIAVAGIGLWTGVATSMLNRTAEFSQTGTSGRGRFVDPLYRAADRLMAPESFYSGIGAGNVDASQIEFPFTKLFQEYGLLSTVAFYGMFLFALFESPPSRTVAWAFLVFHTFGGGGLSVPVYAVTTMLFCTIFSFPREGSSMARWRTVSGAGLLQGRLSAGFPGFRR